MKEFDQMIEGFNRLEERHTRREAMWVAHLMNAAGNMKEPVTADQLLGKSPGKVAHDMEALQRRAEERRRERLRERARKK